MTMDGGPCVADAESYALGLLNEECGEVVQLVGKSLRFGIDTPNGVGPNAETAREMLHKEVGDILAAIRWATTAGVLNHAQIVAHSMRKFDKLTSPNSKDNLGRRLAPTLSSNDANASGEGR